MFQLYLAKPSTSQFDKTRAPSAMEDGAALHTEAYAVEFIEMEEIIIDAGDGEEPQAVVCRRAIVP